MVLLLGRDTMGKGTSHLDMKMGEGFFFTAPGNLEHVMKKEGGWTSPGGSVIPGTSVEVKKLALL